MVTLEQKVYSRMKSDIELAQRKLVGRAIYHAKNELKSQFFSKELSLEYDDVFGILRDHTTPTDFLNIISGLIDEKIENQENVPVQQEDKNVLLALKGIKGVVDLRYQNKKGCKRNHDK